MYADKGTDLSNTEFRKSEKLYKLHREQILRRSKGRIRGGGLRTRPTDLSAVIDFSLGVNQRQSADDAQDNPNGSEDHEVQKCEKAQAVDTEREREREANGHSSPFVVEVVREAEDGRPPVYTLRDRPGFLFVPSALSVEEQRSLITSALRDFPCSPNRTSLTNQFGLLSGLWEASLDNKVLVPIKPTAASLSEDYTQRQQVLDTTAEGMLTTSGDLPEVRDAELSTSSESNHQTQDTSTYQRDAKCGKFNHEMDQESEREAIPHEWVSAANGSENTARSLMRRLRWATLGVQFDWNHRSYYQDRFGAPVPRALADKAGSLAQLAQPQGGFKAEAAIINYYGPADSLGGHRDAMEGDLSQPIVSFSLGCKGVFLLGGPSRYDPPAAFYLRSGDVMMLAGPARQCFHGVPRIFTEAETSDIPVGLTSSEWNDQDMAMYMSQTRININVRHVSRPSVQLW